MGSKKTQVQQNTPGWSQPPSTADMDALRGLRDQSPDYSVPLRNQYARAEQKLSQSYNNPLGAYTSADVRDKTMRAQKLDMQQSLGMDLANAAQQNAQDKWGRYAQVAGMTSPQFYMAQQKVTNPFTVWDGIGMGANVAQGLLT